MSRIFVVAPAGMVTGGPELLHQLVDELRRIGRDAYISYWPLEGPQQTPAAYLKYDAPSAAIDDVGGNLVVLPETLTHATTGIRHADCAIWWLSVDNYFLFPQNHRLKNPLQWDGNRLYDVLRRLRTYRRARRPLRSLRGMLHYTQSHYAWHFLRQAGIKAEMLTDYLGSEHLEHGSATTGALREDLIAYNPKKGFDVTSRLMSAFPDLRFRPLQNMTSAEVAALLRSSKLYIDFGHHPGKDRPPREAAMAGCCVITGRSGAAAFPEDTPTPETYRLDPYANDFLLRFRQSVDEIFKSFPECSTDFDHWRDRIRGERDLFRRQVARLFAG